MDANSLYCSQCKDVDRSTMGAATTTDENGATVRLSQEKANSKQFLTDHHTDYHCRRETKFKMN